VNRDAGGGTRPGSRRRQTQPAEAAIAAIVPVRPLAWMTAMRDHPDRPPPALFAVLACLALRVDWETGCGHASVAQLAADSGAGTRTVERATARARGRGFLALEKRGHRRGDGSLRANEWRLRLPSQPDTEDGLTEVSTRHERRIESGSQPVNQAVSTRQSDRLNPTPQHHHLDLGLQDLGPSSARAGAREDPVRADLNGRDGSAPPGPFVPAVRQAAGTPGPSAAPARQLPPAYGPGRGLCTGCGDWHHVVGLGLIRRHNDPGNWGRTCPGARKPPAEPVFCTDCGCGDVAIQPTTGRCMTCAEYRRRHTPEQTARRLELLRRGEWG
jgi:hypothetical protein